MWGTGNENISLFKKRETNRRNQRRYCVRILFLIRVSRPCQGNRSKEDRYVYSWCRSWSQANSAVFTEWSPRYFIVYTGRIMLWRTLCFYHFLSVCCPIFFPRQKCIRCLWTQEGNESIYNQEMHYLKGFASVAGSFLSLPVPCQRQVPGLQWVQIGMLPTDSTYQ